MRPTLFNFVATPEETDKYASELLDMMIKGHIDVRIHEIYPLKDIARAHQVSLPKFTNKKRGLTLVCTGP